MQNSFSHDDRAWSWNLSSKKSELCMKLRRAYISPGRGFSVGPQPCGQLRCRTCAPRKVARWFAYLERRIAPADRVFVGELERSPTGGVFVGELESSRRTRRTGNRISRRAL